MVYRISPLPRHSLPHGFALLALLILLAVIGVATSATVALGVVVQRRSAEEALLDIGREFQMALQSYASATPAGQSPYPASLHDLLEDPRVPGIHRHLRQVYADPLTGRAEWGLVQAQTQPGIAAITSLSNQQPVKQNNFDADFIGFEHRHTYADWQFKVNPATAR